MQASAMATRQENLAEPASRFLISDLCHMLESYLEPDQVQEVYRAYLFSAEAHENLCRLFCAALKVKIRVYAAAYKTGKNGWNSP